jgi:hypothetical protein
VRKQQQSDAKRMLTTLLCLLVYSDVLLAGKLDHIRLPSHKRVKYMPANYKKVIISIEFSTDSTLGM